jgi:hypothetical protein
MEIDTTSRKREEAVAPIPWTTPAAGVGMPAGYGANWGDVYLYGFVQNRARRYTRIDAAAGGGFGIGNSEKYLGLEVAVDMADVGRILPWNSALGISAKLHRSFPRYALGVAVGAYNLLVYKNPGDVYKNYYGVISKAFRLPFMGKYANLLFLHAGAITGGLQYENQGAGDQSIAPMGGFGIRISEPFSIAASWTGTNLDVGFSIAPFRKFRMTINPMLMDLTSYTGDGMRYGVSIVFADSVFSPTFPFLGNG